ncbi:MAG: UbiA family prenyltransferase [Planctomycetota bacterium]
MGGDSAASSCWSSWRWSWHEASPCWRTASSTVTAAIVVLGACAAAFMGVCALFGLLYGNWWPAWLGLPVLGWLSLYPLCKRFTIASHLVLGSALAISPLAAALAVSPQAIGEQTALWLLAGMVLFWVAGFDVIYALQDARVDREQGLHSIPGRLGAGHALAASRLLHVTAALLLAGAAVVDPRFGLLFMVGVLVVWVLLLYEHRTVANWGTSRIAMAFFTLNGLISCVLGLLGVIDVLW